MSAGVNQRVFSPDIKVPVGFSACFNAWRKARKGKRPSGNQMAFEARWLDRLWALRTALRAGVWQPVRTVSFVVRHPKTREIHAPDFADRVVHHILVERLEKLYEPIFIHDSYANRQGKGSHAAVDRLQQFMRYDNGGGWYLQLDVHNFFNSIHRPTLYKMLCQRLQQAEKRKVLAPTHVLALRSLCHKLLANKTEEIVRHPDEVLDIPPHKRLCNAKSGCGLPVGNLTSQFFANVYLNALDQFVKHRLKCRHYVRYVDDFILLADNPEILRQWQQQIVAFLQDTLRLQLKDAVVLQKQCQGADFLGYRVFADYRRVRPRVVAHCRSKLSHWATQHIHKLTRGVHLCLEAQNLAQLQALIGSYWGHFSHAQSVRLRQELFKQMDWLSKLFTLSPAGDLQAKWHLAGSCFREQAESLFQHGQGQHCLIEKGNRWWLIPSHHSSAHQELNATQTQGLKAFWRRKGQAYVCAHQTGWLRHGIRRREVLEYFYPHFLSNQEILNEPSPSA